ncbi:hypothetical protein AB1A65_16625 [Muricauda sp. ANG21]
MKLRINLLGSILTLSILTVFYTNASTKQIIQKENFCASDSIDCNGKIIKTNHLLNYKRVKDKDANRLVSYLKSNWKSPEQYVIDKFQNHDIIFLSEDHGVKHNLLFVQDLIPSLYDAGVYSIGMEFGASEDQSRLDSLITAPVYNEDIARQIMYNYNVGWGLKEYMDVYRAAWEFNKSLSKFDKKFRIINLSYKFDWSASEESSFGIKTPETIKKIFYKGGTEEYRANIIKETIINKNEKIIILTGGLHAFTKYHQPEYDYYKEGFFYLNDRSFGNLVYRMVPDKVFTILLHYPFYNKTKSRLIYPAMGKIDEALSSFVDKRVGFDLYGTPFGDLRDTSYFSIGYPNFRLGDMADGYIYFKPFEEYEGCTIDEKFFEDQRWVDILGQYPDQDRLRKPKNLEEYIEIMKNYVDIKVRYKSLMGVGPVN